MSNEGEDRCWMYMDQFGGQKGPVPASLLMRLLEKGIQISGTTLVWKQGMASWLAMNQVQPFQETANFHLLQWYFQNAEGETQGPLMSRFLLHKMQNGEIDGLTLIFSQQLGEWKKFADVEILREAAMKLSREEEEAIERAAKAAEAADQEALVQQTFVLDDDIPGPVLASFTSSSAGAGAGVGASASSSSSSSLSSSASKKGGGKKIFVADDGQKLVWDEQEQDWVQVEGEAMSEDEDEEAQEEEDEEEDEDEEGTGTTGNDKSNGKRKASASGTASSAGGDASAAEGEEKKKRKKNKKKKTKKPGDHNWVYITGLPLNVTKEEIKDHFSRVGLIAIDPIDQEAKIKLYRDESGSLQGDCSLCYNAPESVAMAVDVLSGGYIRPSHQVTVTKAEFQAAVAGAKGGGGGGGGDLNGGDKKRARTSVTQAQLKTAKTVMQQQLAWNEDDDIGVQKSKALRIVVLEGMFVPADFEVETFSDELEQDVASECGKFGNIEKITVFAANVRGIVLVKYSTAFAAQECVQSMNGRFFGGTQIKCSYWDGSTNYGAQVGSSQAEEEEKKEEERLKEYGDWLEQEQEELPEEFRLNVES